MLSYFFLKQKYVNYIKNNFYLDYGLKFLTKVFVYNVSIQLAFFFAEKYLIEYYTRFMFNYFSISTNKLALRLNSKVMFFYMVIFAANVLILLI